MLGHVGRRDQVLGQGARVVRQELDPQLAAGRRVVVHHPADAGDELDDVLGQVVRRGRLAGEQDSARRHVQARVGPQPVVPDHHLDGVQELSLVLVDALDLDVEDGVRVERDARGGLDPVHEPGLGGPLGRQELVLEAGVVGQHVHLAQAGHVGHPLGPGHTGEELR